jgi:hypothetical protein
MLRKVWAQQEIRTTGMMRMSQMRTKKRMSKYGYVKSPKFRKGRHEEMR